MASPQNSPATPTNHGYTAGSAPLVPQNGITVRPLCWGSIFAGAVAALAVHLLLTILGLGLGLEIVEPATNPDGGSEFSVGAGIAWSLSALIALWLGGWIAGRLIPEASRRLGGLHGFLVWSLATVVTISALSTGAGMLAGSVARLTGQALGSTAEALAPAAAAGGDALGQFARDNSNVFEGFVQELQPGDQGGQPNSASTREVSWALVRYFTQPADQRGAEAKNALVRSIAESTPLDEAAAREKVDQWIASYDRIEADMKALADRAALEARAAAETASGYITATAIWTFIAFVIGAVASAWGGAMGARSRRLHDTGAVA